MQKVPSRLVRGWFGAVSALALACACQGAPAPGDGEGGEGGQGQGGEGAEGGSAGGGAGRGGGMATGGASAGGAGAAATGGAGVAGAGGGGTAGLPDGGVGGTAGDAGADLGPLEPAIMAVGYGAMRLVSFDGGKTWTNRVVNDPGGGDDANLIRAVNWVGDRWVAVGWKIFISRDGISWKEIDDRTVPGGWYDCVTGDANGTIVVKTIRADAGGQNGPTIQSTDGGETWREAPRSTRCQPPSQPFPSAAGATLRSEWRGKITRSYGGRTTTVHDDCCGIVMFAEGRAARK